MYKKIPTLENGKWSYTDFPDRKSWIDFLRSQFKEVGKYKLTNTKLWNELGTKFIKEGKYNDLPKNSKGYHEFWLKEGVKCERGVIYKSTTKHGVELSHYVTGYYYFYLNFFPITVKHEENKQMMPNLWDLDFHTFLYIERGVAEGKYVACNKRRQTGWSYKMAAIVMCDMWFKLKQTIKVFSKGSKYVSDFFNYCATERNHLITHTGWNRQFWRNAGKELQWHMIWNAQEAGRDIQIGRDNKFTGINTSTTSEKLVGGFNTLVISEESGVDSELLKNIGYVDASLKQGDIVTGKFICGGSVGELVNCEGLRSITYNPRDYGFLPVPDLADKSKERVLFIPVQWNYIHPITDPEDDSIIIGQVKCYDEDGNSDVNMALKLINETRLRKQKQDPASYTLYCAQNPMTLDELYQSRENNLFDGKLILKQKTFLEEEWEDQTVELEEVDGKIIHRYVKKPIVTDFPLKTNSYREGCVVMKEPPIKNPKPFMYFAGVDPVKLLQGGGTSLFSIYVYLNPYEENNILKGGYIVAWYTGRYFDDNDTFEVGRKLIKYYNAMTNCEPDVDSFINYMKSKNEEHYLLKRKQIPIMKDLVPNSNISGDEYGTRMNTGGNSSRLKKHGLTKLKEYVEEKLDVHKDEEGNDVVKWGIERIYDRMLLKEMENYSETDGNYDRIVAVILCLIAAKCYESNRVMQKIYTEQVKNNEQQIIKITSQFGSRFNMGNGLRKTRYNLR